jgi:hypothetical protein
MLALVVVGCGTNSTTTVVKERTVTAAPPASAPPTTTTPVLAQYTPYQGPGYTARIPTGWATESDAADHGSYVESVFRDPTDPNSSITIDLTPNVTESPAASAAQVHSDTAKTPGYSELDFEPTTIRDRDAFEWSFKVSGDRRVDFFFNDCGNGLALLGSAPPGVYPSVKPVFQAVVESVQGDCASSAGGGGASQPPPAPPPVSSGSVPASGGGSFCDTHPCIENFDEGNGYPVECSDGMWSQSGGIQGACSGHGGVRP